jgi:uncharacterized cupin superfamily protein
MKKAILVEKLSQDEARGRGVAEWPIWECEPSQFPWHYDQEECCYLLEGEVTVHSEAGAQELGPGDYVTFPRDLDCTWNVRTKVRKHYTFP